VDIQCVLVIACLVGMLNAESLRRVNDHVCVCTRGAAKMLFIWLRLKSRRDLNTRCAVQIIPRQANGNPFVGSAVSVLVAYGWDDRANFHPARRNFLSPLLYVSGNEREVVACPIVLTPRKLGRDRVSSIPDQHDRIHCRFEYQGPKKLSTELNPRYHFTEGLLKLTCREIWIETE